MNADPIYVLDTHALVWFLKRNKPLGRRALSIMLDCNSQLVAPIFVFEEIAQKSIRSDYRSDRVGIPPGTALRVVLGSSNIKVLPKSPAVALEIMRLERAVNSKKEILPKQDIPICATALAITKALRGHSQVFLISRDSGIRKWGRIPMIWE